MIHGSGCWATCVSSVAHHLGSSSYRTAYQGCWRLYRTCSLIGHLSRMKLRDLDLLNRSNGLGQASWTCFGSGQTDYSASSSSCLSGCPVDSLSLRSSDDPCCGLRCISSRDGALRHSGLSDCQLRSCWSCISYPVCLFQ